MCFVLSHALCFMYNVLCTMCYVLCAMCHAMCYVLCVTLCIMYYELCLICYVIYTYIYILESVGALRAPLILLLAYSLTTFLSSPRCTPSTHTPQPRAQENAIMSLKHSSLKSVAHPRNDNRHQSYSTWSWHYIQAWICRMWSRALQLRWTQNQKLIARVTSVNIRQASYLCKRELTITKKRNQTGHICSSTEV